MAGGVTARCSLRACSKDSALVCERTGSPTHAFRSPKGAKLANDVIMRAPENTDVPPGTWHVTAKAIAEQLRQVWNARGAVDIAKLAVLMVPDDGTGTVGSIVSKERLAAGIKALDR